jgi:hypothetical protein
MSGRRVTVVVLHGLARTHLSMNALRKHLEREGFDTWSPTYPSRRMGIAELARHVEERLRRERKGCELMAVTHSLGGIVVRHMDPALGLSRVVMLAPPNAGSRLARSLGSNPLFRWYFGRAGEQLGSPDGWPAPPAPFAVIAGTRSSAAINPTTWLSRRAGVFAPNEPNDGTLSVSETQHPAMAAFATIAASHTWIMNDPKARALTVEFLRHGRMPE